MWPLQTGWQRIGVVLDQTLSQRIRIWAHVIYSLATEVLVAPLISGRTEQPTSVPTESTGSGLIPTDSVHTKNHRDYSRFLV